MVNVASFGPCDGPLAAFNVLSCLGKRVGAERHEFAGERVLLVRSHINAFCACCPCGVLKTTVASEIPAASEGLISATFQVRFEFQPNIFFRKALKVVSLGSVAELAEVPAADLAGHGGRCLRIGTQAGQRQRKYQE